MRGSLQFVGGVLVGLGLATSVFGLWIWTMLHHMFILGVSNWAVAGVVMVLPLLMMLLGAGLALAGRNRSSALRIDRD